ncbi:hypothetical protein [Bacteroides sp. OM05-12]|jgi:hypothetical protein|uniref:hypothetical protein n=1 Tax=Bacteroides sp. OM05-12 TaxID=2292283 RepID=UPI000E89810D|nr:hypothetical protein [Bacteroides sp. OM05-12]RGN46072.1 hypothetical protein DXB63_11775 [Bacteroides sp. OM05-12]
MIAIELIGGLDSRLYELVAPLVMNPEVLRQNRNYPFKTTKKHQWLIAISQESVIGFLPMEIRDKQVIINNYYTKEENQEVLDLLIKNAIKFFGDDYYLVSVTQRQHIPTFLQNGFTIELEWKNYVKMKKAE